MIYTTARNSEDTRWKTYNFEVAKHHTYVADGVRVHNSSVTYSLNDDGELETLVDEYGDQVEVVGSWTPAQAYHYGIITETTNPDGSTTKSLESNGVLGGLSALGRSFADAIGLDGRFGLQGTFATPEEGVIVDYTDYHEEGRPPEYREDWSGDQDHDGVGDWNDENFSNIGHWGSDRDGDGVPNHSDYNDGVGWLDNNPGGGGDTSGKGKPIILDLDGDGIEIEVTGRVSFDMDADGFLEQTAWVGADDAFLVIDMNADGTRGVGDAQINQTQELILTQWLDSGGVTDLQALALFDISADMGGNNDGVISAADTVWSELRAWQDANLNGVADDGELHTLESLGFSEIALTYDDGTAYDDNRNDINILGSTLLGTASYIKDGQAVVGGVGDVSLKYDSSGWRRIETSTGYSIELETGEIAEILDLSTQADSDADLAGADYSGAIGDDRNNVISADPASTAAFLDGSAGNDTLIGGANSDQIFGGIGNDTINGKKGNDLLVGNDGNDRLFGGPGNDVLYGDAGNDELYFQTSLTGPQLARQLDLVNIIDHGIGNAYWANKEKLVADVNGDGYDDIIAFSGSDAEAILVLHGQEDGSFSHHVTTNHQIGNYWWSKKHKLIGDVNGDGRDDIVAFGENAADHIYVLQGQVDGSFSNQAITGHSFGSSWWGHRQKLLGDINGDGRADIVAFNESNDNPTIVTLLGQENGQFSGAIHTSDGHGNAWWGHKRKFVGDVNGDGYDDIVALSETSSSQIKVLLGGSDGRFNTAISTVHGLANEHWANRKVYLEDYDGDGLDDLIGITGSDENANLIVLYGTSSGQFSGVNHVSNVYAAAEANGNDQLMGDINGDGKVDLITFAESQEGEIHVTLSEPEIDVATGGEGDDLFVFEESFGVVYITDFEADNSNEKIDLSEISEVEGWVDLRDNHLTTSENNVVIDLGVDQITLAAVELVDLGANDFIL